MTVGGITVIQAAANATGWRPDELPVMDAVVTNTGVNLRSGPSVNQPVAAVLKPAVRLIRLGADEGGWVPVAVLGWISNELLNTYT